MQLSYFPSSQLKHLSFSLRKIIQDTPTPSGGNSNSKETLIELLKHSNLKTYKRNGLTTGIVFNGKKFRLSKLGFSKERFDTLERTGKRELDLTEIRKSYLERIINNRNR